MNAKVGVIVGGFLAGATSQFSEDSSASSDDEYEDIITTLLVH